MPKKPEYVSIDETLKAELLAGRYDSAPLPSNGTLARRFDVNMKTAGRAVQQLVAEGILMARPGMRAAPVPKQLRATRWPMTGRYARARAAQGLIFDTDITGDIRKETISRAWEGASFLIARLLRVDPGASVFHRQSHTLTNDTVTEVASMHFPTAIIEAVPRLEQENSIRVVPLIEEMEFVVTRTENEIRARQANRAEQGVFGILAGDVVFEHAHGTYGADGRALEAVINVRPAHGNVATFDTYEAPISDEQE
jgi:DNA-binding GntR family transcriptional regulator